MSQMAYWGLTTVVLKGGEHSDSAPQRQGLQAFLVSMLQVGSCWRPVDGGQACGGMPYGTRDGPTLGITWHQG